MDESNPLALESKSLSGCIDSSGKFLDFDFGWHPVTYGPSRGDSRISFHRLVRLEAHLLLGSRVALINWHRVVRVVLAFSHVKMDE